MTLAGRLQTHDHQSWSSNVELGDRRVLPSGVDVSEGCMISPLLITLVLLDHKTKKPIYRVTLKELTFTGFSEGAWTWRT